MSIYGVVLNSDIEKMATVPPSASNKNNIRDQN